MFFLSAQAPFLASARRVSRGLRGLACIWSDAAKAYTVLIILRYFVLFMAGFGAVLFCFDVSPLMALFCATGGYALQHFSYIFASFASAWLRAETWKVLSAFVYVGIFAALYAAGYLFFASCMKRAKDVLSREKAVIFFSAGVLLCVIVFSALCDAARACGRHIRHGGAFSAGGEQAPAVCDGEFQRDERARARHHRQLHDGALAHPARDGKRGRLCVRRRVCDASGAARDRREETPRKL